jgi:hypothetical protein
MNLGAPILDVSVTVASAGGSASSAPAPAVSIVSGGTVTAPGYTPIIITKTVANDPVMAAAAAAAATQQTAVQTNSAYSTVTTAGSTAYVSTDKDGSAGYDVVTISGTKFAPDVQVVVNKQSGGSTPSSTATVTGTETRQEIK